VGEKPGRVPTQLLGVSHTISSHRKCLPRSTSPCEILVGWRRVRSFSPNFRFNIQLSHLFRLYFSLHFFPAMLMTTPIEPLCTATCLLSFGLRITPRTSRFDKNRFSAPSRSLSFFPFHTFLPPKYPPDPRDVVSSRSQLSTRFLA